MANKKAEILTMDGQVVSPITLATNVLLDDGRTAQDLLDSRDESMFSPTITTSSSISKVGQGDNVDFSENVIDGAYKSCVLKGKTLVNYNAEGNDRDEYDCTDNADDVKYQAIIKPSTKYSIVFNRTLASGSLTVDLGGATANVVSTTLGKTIVQITTLPTLTHNYVKFLGVGNVIKDVQVIEGEVVGDEPYFEGMADVKNPSVMNCNTLDTEDENYKSNTISTNDVVLRSLPNGVSDTLDLETGVYVQRIGEVVLDGSENWGKTDSSTHPNAYFIQHDASKVNSKLLTNKLNHVTSYNKDTVNSIWKGFTLAIFPPSEINSLTLFKEWLSQNPIPVQYELATPITTTIDLKQHPFAYKDGYVVLTSSSEEVSLTPTIEYSLIANRLGQIQTNQKLVEKQQAQIDELESMVITNLVNTQYQQALNEIKLGVK